MAETKNNVGGNLVKVNYTETQQKYNGVKEFVANFNAVEELTLPRRNWSREYIHVFNVPENGCIHQKQLKPVWVGRLIELASKQHELTFKYENGKNLDSDNVIIRYRIFDPVTKAFGGWEDATSKYSPQIRAGKLIIQNEMDYPNLPGGANDLINVQVAIYVDSEGFQETTLYKNVVRSVFNRQHRMSEVEKEAMIAGVGGVESKKKGATTN